jgi:hypothetical protein
MAKQDRSARFFTVENIRQTSDPLPRLIRLIFHYFQITNDSFADRYHRFYTHIYGTDRQGVSQINMKKNIDKNALINGRRNLTIKSFINVLKVFGFDIVEMTVTLKDSTSGELHTFSTTLSAEEIDAVILKKQEEEASQGFL